MTAKKEHPVGDKPAQPEASKWALPAGVSADTLVGDLSGLLNVAREVAARILEDYGPTFVMFLISLLRQRQSFQAAAAAGHDHEVDHAACCHKTLEHLVAALASCLDHCDRCHGH